MVGTNYRNGKNFINPKSYEENSAQVWPWSQWLNQIGENILTLEITLFYRLAQWTFHPHPHHPFEPACLTLIITSIVITLCWTSIIMLSNNKFSKLYYPPPTTPLPLYHCFFFLQRLKGNFIFILFFLLFFCFSF